MEGGGKKRISDTRGKRIRREITKDLAAYDLAEWQKACKGFGPIHNDHETRREYYETNRFRLEAAREIVDFVGVWEEHLKSDFESEPRTDIRKRIIAAVRAAQRKKKMELGLLNVVKLSGFKTLIKWADNPGELAKQRLYRSREETEELQGTPTNVRRERMKILG